MFLHGPFALAWSHVLIHILQQNEGFEFYSWHLRSMLRMSCQLV